MGKNYMPEIARILGIKMNELFDVVVEDGKNSSCGPFYFDDEWKIRDNDDGLVPLWFFEKILTGKYTIQEHPWKPKDGEKCWTVSLDGCVTWCRFHKDSEDSLAHMNMGNCFPTRDAAEAGRSEILAKFEEIRKEVRE